MLRNETGRQMLDLFSIGDHNNGPLTSNPLHSTPAEKAMAQSKGYIVKRLLVDGHASGRDVRQYIKVDKPNPGELVYHGDFTKRRIEIADNGPMGSEYADVYIPVDESKLTSEPYNGGDEVETF